MKTFFRFVSNVILIILLIAFIKWYIKMLNHEKYKWYFRIYLIIAILYIIGTPSTEEKYDNRTGAEIWSENVK